MHLDRLITVLETVAVAGRPITAAELQQASGLPRPTCYRLLQTLAEHRLLDEPDAGGRYLIGERLVRIALLGQTDLDVRAALRALADAGLDPQGVVGPGRIGHGDERIGERFKSWLVVTHEKVLARRTGGTASGPL